MWPSLKYNPYITLEILWKTTESTITSDIRTAGLLSGCTALRVPTCFAAVKNYITRAHVQHISVARINKKNYLTEEINVTNFCSKMCRKSKKTKVTDSQNEYRSIKYCIENVSLQQKRKYPFIVRIVKVNAISSVPIKRNRVPFEEKIH